MEFGFIWICKSPACLDPTSLLTFGDLDTTRWGWEILTKLLFWSQLIIRFLRISKVFVDSMQQTKGGDDGDVVYSGWWRGFRAKQGPGGPMGFFPSSHVTLIHPRAASQLLASASGSSGELKPFHPVVDLVVSCVHFSRFIHTPNYLFFTRALAPVAATVTLQYR